MILLSPRKIDFPFRIVIGGLECDYTHTSHSTNSTIHGTVSLIYFGTEEWKKGTSSEVLMNVTWPLEDSLIHNLVRMQGLINICINQAEEIKNKLIDINIGIAGGTAEVNQSIRVMDFMLLKDRFRDYIRKNPAFKHLLADKQTTKNMDLFVTNRNIYTHGILKIRYDYKDFIIQYIHHKKTAYAFINEEIIATHATFYLEFRKLIIDFMNIKNLAL